MAERQAHYPTIKDVAELARTSTATVSYVLNEDPSRAVSAELRARVLAAAKKLNYSKSAVASSLRVCKSGLVFILIPQFSNIYFTRVCEKLEDALFSAGYLPVISDTREDPERERALIESAIKQRVDGVILGPTSKGWSNTIPLRERNVPFVTIGREIFPEDGHTVSDATYFVGDNSYQAGCKAAHCLLENGHRRVGVIEWQGGVSSTLEREKGFYDVMLRYMQEDGFLEIESSTVLTTEEGYRMTKALLERTKPTALFYGYHRHALGGVQYLDEVGYKIPDDISVIMVGTPSWAKISSPKYHMIYQNEDWVGRTAGQLLIDQLEGNDSALLQAKKHICSCTLVEGTSVKNLAEK